MKGFKSILTTLLLLLFFSNVSLAQVVVDWKMDPTTNLTVLGTTIKNQFGALTCKVDKAYSGNILSSCLDGFVEGNFVDFSGNPATALKWIFTLDDQYSTFSTYEYAIVVEKDNMGVYRVQAGKDYNPCTGTFSGTASTPLDISSQFPSDHPFRISRVSNATNHTVSLTYNGADLIAPFTNESIKSLSVVVELPLSGAQITAVASFDGTCAAVVEDWKGASTGTLTPFIASDNVLIPSQLTVESIPLDNAANRMLVTDNTGLISRQDVAVDWRDLSNSTPTALSDDIYKMGSVGIGTSANQARLHVDDIACDNLPAFRVSGPGVSTACTFPDVHGHLIQAESYDNLGFMVPRFVTTYDGRVGIGTGTPAYTLHVNGNIYASGSYFSSDQRFKNHIKPVDNALDLVMQLKGTSYTYRTSEFPERNFRNGTQYGFIAQELRDVLPELVDEDDDGYLAVDYVALIPILTEALKLQQTEIQELTERVSTLENIALGNTIRNQANEEEKGFGNLALEATLGQNSPNPFTDKTSIHFFLPESIQQAHLVIFDMNGKQLEGYPVAQRGNNSLSLSLSHLGAGMFMYSLIADNQEVDTKRMILTE